MLLHGVSASADRVRAQVGDEVTVGLTLFCNRRSSDGEGLEGLAVPALRDRVFGGWLLNADGVPIHVTEASAQSEIAFIAEIRERETRVRVQGSVSVADQRALDDVKDRWELDLRRPWRIRRILRSASLGQEEVKEIDQGGGYLLDLERP